MFFNNNLRYISKDYSINPDHFGFIDFVILLEGKLLIDFNAIFQIILMGFILSVEDNLPNIMNIENMFDLSNSHRIIRNDKDKNNKLIDRHYNIWLYRRYMIDKIEKM